MSHPLCYNRFMIIETDMKNKLKTFEVRIRKTTDAWCAYKEWTSTHEVEAEDKQHAARIALSRYCYHGTNASILNPIKEIKR